MATAYRAVTTIDGGREKNGGNVEKFYFKEGSVVTGLTKAEMKHLWDNGALVQVDTVEVEKAEVVKEDPAVAKKTPEQVEEDKRAAAEAEASKNPFDEPTPKVKPAE